MKIEITKEIVEKCHEFAVLTESNTADSGRRTKQQKIKDIKIGKIGEWAFYLLYKDLYNLSEPNMRTDQIDDGGVDFFSNIGRIDVKTTSFPGDAHLIFNKNPRADVYVLCFYDAWANYDFDEDVSGSSLFFDTPDEEDLLPSVSVLFYIDIRLIPDLTCLPSKSKFGKNNYSVTEKQLRKLQISIFHFLKEIKFK